MRQSTRLDVMIACLLVGPQIERTEGRRGDLLDGFGSWDLIKNANLDTVSAAAEWIDNSDLHEFRERVAALDQSIVGVLAEEGEAGERHITTFIVSDSDNLRSKIYEIEAEIIEKFRSRVFDFHVRVAPRGADGQIQLPRGPYYLLVWRS